MAICTMVQVLIGLATRQKLRCEIRYQVRRRGGVNELGTVGDLERVSHAVFHSGMSYEMCEYQSMK